MGDQDKIQWVYSSKDNQELSDRYDQWAKDYDAELEKDYKWCGPQLAADYFFVLLANKNDVRLKNIGFVEFDVYGSVINFTSVVFCCNINEPVG